VPENRFTPSISVVIPTCGRRPLLEQTLDSVRAQTLGDWEAVVVDDRSPDDTAAYLSAAAARDPRIRPVPRAGDAGGANVARNQGLHAAAGRYVIFLDSDDLLEPDCLRRRVRHLDGRPDLDFTVHAMRCFRERPGDADTAWNTLTDEDDFDRFLLMDGPWQTAGATWRRAALDRVGPWDPAVLSLQDLAFHLQALAVGLRYEKVNAYDCHYRLPQGRHTITSQHRSLDHFRSHARIAHRLLDLDDAVLAATPRRRDLLGGFCFLIANRCATNGDVTAGLDLWRHTRRRRIVRGRRFAEGAAVLLGQQWPAVLPGLRRVTFNRWRPPWRVEFRHTFLQAPLPPRATDPDPDGPTEQPPAPPPSREPVAASAAK
jgi:glycosyltransferase involved in cell wall biosynthesis